LIPANTVKLLPIAAKLRNTPLFKECLIHLTVPWTKPRYLELTDPKLQRVVRRAYNDVCATITKAYENLLYAANTPGFNGDKACRRIARNIISMAEFGMAHARANDRLNLPLYYRDLYESHDGSSSEIVRTVLAHLFKKNLLLDKSGATAGFDKYIEYFLCAEIDDEDLPWDINQKDW
jgi:hypothetical protein